MYQLLQANPDLGKYLITTLHSTKLARKSKQRKTLFCMESPSSSCSHRRNMLVADSKPLNDPHSSSEQPATLKMLQQGGSEPYKMELASDTLWTHRGKL